MPFTVAEIAAAVGAQAVGNTDISLTGVAEPADAKANQLAFAGGEKFAGGLAEGNARAALLWEDADWQALGLEAAICVPRPRFAMAAISRLFDPGTGFEAGIHASAVIHPDATLGKGVSVGALSVVEAGAQIGAGSVIGPQCYVGQGAVLGAGALLHPGVRIASRVTIGDRFLALSGAVIGGDGFSFVTREVSSAETARATMGDVGENRQSWERIQSLGSVSIGDDVEVGANSTIDKGTVRDTRIGNGCKIDNQVQIGHNVEIGDDTMFCGQSGSAGSTRIGRNVVVGGRVAINDNIFVGDGAVLGGGSGVASNVPAGRMVMGYPAVPMDAHVEIYKALRRLPRMMRDFATLKKAVSKSDESD